MSASWTTSGNLKALRAAAIVASILIGGLGVATWFPVDLSGAPFLYLLGGMLTAVVIVSVTIFAYQSAGRVGSSCWRAKTLLPFFPLWARFALATVLVYGVVNFCYTILSGQLPGQPIQSGHLYYFNNHGVKTYTTRSGYLGGIRVWIRLFTGIELMFLACPTLALMYAPPAILPEL